MRRVYIAPSINPHDDAEHICNARDFPLRQARAQMAPDTYRWTILESGLVQLYIEGDSAPSVGAGEG